MLSPRSSFNPPRLHPRLAPFRFPFLVAVVLAAAAVGQVSVPGALRPWSVAPDLVLFTAVAVGLLRGPLPGAWTGLAGAYLLTSLFPFSPGSLYLNHIAVGYGAGLIRSHLYTEHPLVAPCAGAAAGLAAETIFYLLNPRSPAIWVQSSLAQMLYGLIVGPLLYLLLIRLAGPPIVEEPPVV